MTAFHYQVLDATQSPDVGEYVRDSYIGLPPINCLSTPVFAPESTARPPPPLPSRASLRRLRQARATERALARTRRQQRRTDHAEFESARTSTSVDPRQSSRHARLSK